MDKILIAVDGSENSMRAVDFAVKMFKEKQDDIQITILHVIIPIESFMGFFNYVPVPQLGEQLEKYARETLDQAKGVFTSSGLKAQTVITYGDPGRSIGDYAKNNDITHIIMGTRGMGEIKGLVMGSVSHQVIHFTRCPVTLVK